MKILKYLIIFLSAIILIFFAVGLIWPTFTYESKVTVEAPADKVWEVFTDAEAMPQWMEGFKGIETIRSAPGEVGSEYNVIIESDGQEVQLHEIVTHFEPGKLYGMDIKSDVLDNKALISFDAEGNTTTITAKNEVSGNGLFWKSLLFLMKSTIQKTSDDQYGRLKEVIEAKK